MFLRHYLEVLYGAPPVLAADFGEAPDAMYAIADKSKTKLFLGPTEFRHLPALCFKGGWCVDKESLSWSCCCLRRIPALVK